MITIFFFFQAEDGIRDLVRSRGLGDVYKRQLSDQGEPKGRVAESFRNSDLKFNRKFFPVIFRKGCLLYTSDAADERSSVDLGGRRIIKKKKYKTIQKEQVEMKT